MPYNWRGFRIYRDALEELSPKHGQSRRQIELHGPCSKATELTNEQTSLGLQNGNPMIESIDNKQLLVSLIHQHPDKKTHSTAQAQLRDTVYVI
jgi:hypothetical protein